jgi:hypothetical protein
MKSAEKFLENLKAEHLPALSQPLSSGIDAPGVEIPSSLTSALKRGWPIVPVLAQSKYFSSKALAGHPTRDSVQVREWWRQYFENGVNWATELGARADLLVLEFDYEVGHRILPHLCGGDLSWRKTLQFTDAHARFACFHYTAQRLRSLGEKYQGVRVHTRNFILIPPSTYSTGEEVSYLNPGSKVLEAPDWLLETSRTRNETMNTFRNDMGDYFVA